MRIILIRHGSPDYPTDSLLPQGIQEAGALGKRVKKWNVDAFYTSPMGRARQTAKLAMKDLDREAIVLPWLEEWRGRIWNQEKEKNTIPWNLYPYQWSMNEKMYEYDSWSEDSIFHSGLDNTQQIWDETRHGIDSLLETYGYQRTNGCCYVHGEPEEADTTIVLFCHCGIMSAIISYLLGIPAPVLWNGVWVAPTSVTVLATDERQKNNARFVMQFMGDTTHLHDAGVPVANMGYLAKLWSESI